jgi:hypothetical protein
MIDTIKNPVVLSVKHDRQTPLKSTWNVLSPQHLYASHSEVLHTELVILKHITSFSSTYDGCH